MTQFGHTLTGLSIGVICLPENKSTPGKIVHLAVFALLANLPDFPFKNWGHDLYFFSHSIFINLLLIIFILPVFVFWRDMREKIGGWIVVIGGVLAWMSHLLLDMFYNHGLGLRMFWPLSDARLALPVPWFSVVHNPPPPLTVDTVRIVLVEFACYGMLFVLTVAVKKSRILHYIKRCR